MWFGEELLEFGWVGTALCKLEGTVWVTADRFNTRASLRNQKQKFGFAVVPECVYRPWYCNILQSTFQVVDHKVLLHSQSVCILSLVVL
jgi:hypothetical protein